MTLVHILAHKSMRIKCLAQLRQDGIYQGNGEEKKFYSPRSATRLHHLYVTVNLLRRPASHIPLWVVPLEAQSHLYPPDKTVDIKAI